MGTGAVIVDCELSDCVVGEGAHLEGCRLTASLVGDHCRLQGVAGSVNLGDYSEISGS